MIIKSTPETVAEAKRALSEFMQRSRQARETGDTSILLPVDAGASFTVEDKAQHISSVSSDPAQRAADYAKARNQNLRPLRQIDETDENACEGRDSALAFLEKRRRSLIRK